MSGHDGFLRAIAASPEDDHPRLIYADWLEERGEVDRAEFIRVQCALARCEEDDERERLGAIEHRLLRMHRCREGWVPRPVQEFAGGWGFERGFFARMKLEAEEFLDRGELLRATPPIRHLDLTGVQGQHIVALEGSDLLDGLASLDMSEFFADEGPEGRGRAFPAVDRLVRRLKQAGIGELGLSPAAVAPIFRAWGREPTAMPTFTVGAGGPGGRLLFEGIAASGYRRNLRRACVAGVSPREFFGSNLGSRLDGLESLRLVRFIFLWDAREPHPWEWRESPGERSPRHLRSLELRNGVLGPDDLALLLDGSRLAALGRLGLSDIKPLGNEFSGLFRGGPHPALRSLSISGVDLGPALASLPRGAWGRFPGLTRLELAERGSDWGDRVLAAIADSPLAGRLRSLALRGMRVTAEGIRALRRSGLLARLYALELGERGLGDDAVDALLAAGPWPDLALLDLQAAGLSKRARRKAQAAFGPLAVWTGRRRPGEAP